MRIEVRQWGWDDERCWSWSCPVCHDGHNFPWRLVSTWGDAMDEVASHLALHRVTGKYLAWAEVPVPR